MTRFVWLLRREFWEHRAIWIAPAVVLGVLLLGAVTGNVFLGQVRIDSDISFDGSSDEARERTRQEVAGLTEQEVAQLSGIRSAEDVEKLERSGTLDKAKAAGRSVSPGEALALVPPEKRQTLLLFVYIAVAVVMFMVMGVIGFFYALDALYADRRDRSVLFWKSLPLSDTETVLSKFVVAAVAIPVVAVLATLAGQLIVASGGSLKLAFTGGEAGIMWMPQALGGGALAAALTAVVCALWYAPLTAYLLLASAWAPKSPFLWAVLPPVALSMLEKIAFGTGHVATFLKQSWLAPFSALFSDSGLKSDSAARATHMLANLRDLLLSPEMLLGLLAAAALLAGAVFVRRYRDESM